MKHVVLLHGTGGTPDNFWFAWVRDELTAQGYTVDAPQLPEAESPKLALWTPYVLENVPLRPETILIGHSAGCPLILSLLQHRDSPVRRSIMVAGFLRLAGMEDDSPMLLQNPDWERIKANAGSLFLLHSDNDPWGCDHHQGEALREKLGGTLVVCSGEAHFGSKRFNQPYPDFPLLKSLCLLP